MKVRSRLLLILSALTVALACPALRAADEVPAPPAPAAAPPTEAAPAAAAAEPPAAAVPAPAPAVSTDPAAVVATQEDTLAAGDMIRIRMDEDPSMAFEGIISAAGTVPIPFVGEFVVASRTPAEAARLLQEALTKELYQQATVSVTLISKAPGKVYVYGAVRRPGFVEMPPLGNLTVMQVLSYVDGLTSWAAPEEAYILRRARAGEAPQRIPLNLTEMFANYTPLSDSDIPLQTDDVVCIPGLDGKLNFSADTCEIIIVGEVNAPGLTYFAPGEQRTLMRAIFKAGGFSKFAKSRAVRLIRYGKDKERTEQVVDAARIIDEGYLDEDIELKPGDMLIVPQKLINF